MKKDLIKGILLLKSAFSVIDQMFQQEIINHEIRQKHWFRRLLCGNKCSNKIVNPRELNSFVENLMDPFKNITTEPSHQS